MQYESTKMVKIGFKLNRDEENYPPADWEWLWAVRVSDTTLRIESVPFFAKLISFGDTVAVEQTDDGLIFKELMQSSGHSTVRVILHRNDRSDDQLHAAVEEVRRVLTSMGCSSELSHIPSLVAIDIPPEVSYPLVAAFLSEQEENGVLGYEEASVAS